MQHVLKFNDGSGPCGEGKGKSGAYAGVMKSLLDKIESQRPEARNNHVTANQSQESSRKIGKPIAYRCVRKCRLILNALRQSIRCSLY